MVRILIADDEPAVRGVLSVALESEGYEVTAVGNGQEALDFYVQNPVEVVITDVFMPEKDGIELISEIRALNPEATIIAMSSGGRRGRGEYLDVAWAHGASHVLAKPFAPEDLLDVIVELTRQL
jgi:CheY-like chemotaxis protein